MNFYTRSVVDQTTAGAPQEALGGAADVLEVPVGQRIRIYDFIFSTDLAGLGPDSFQIQETLNGGGVWADIFSFPLRTAGGVAVSLKSPLISPTAAVGNDVAGVLQVQYRMAATTAGGASTVTGTIMGVTEIED